jgi:hypothetical protein
MVTLRRYADHHNIAKTRRAIADFAVGTDFVADAKYGDDEAWGHRAPALRRPPTACGERVFAPSRF